MKSLFYFCSCIVFISLFCCSSERENPLEGKTYELISAKYFENDSLVTFPATTHDKSIEIWGKSHVVAVWQDTSRNQSSFFAGHKYTIDADSITLKVMYFFPGQNFIGKSFKAKYEIRGDQLIFEGLMPGMNEQHEKYREVWGRID